MNGFNPNSVIGSQYMHGPGGMPVTNIMNISGAGYNQGMMGGYYNPHAQSYYNPYLIHQQQQKLESKMKEEKKKQSEIWKKLSRNVNSATGLIENIEDHVKRYDPIEENNEEYIEEMKYHKLQSIQNNHVVNNVRINAVVEIHNRTKSEFPDEMSLAEYFDKAGQLIVEARIEESRNRQRDVSRLYDRTQYSDLVKMHSRDNNYFNSVFAGGYRNPHVSIDDMEVKLPDSISNEYFDKKRAFLESIFK